MVLLILPISFQTHPDMGAPIIMLDRLTWLALCLSPKALGGINLPSPLLVGAIIGMNEPLPLQIC